MSEQEVGPLAAPLTMLAAPVDGWCELDGSACGVTDVAPTADPDRATLDAPQPATDPT